MKFITSKSVTPIIRMSSSSSKGFLNENVYCDLFKLNSRVFCGVVLFCSKNVSFLVEN